MQCSGWAVRSPQCDFSGTIREKWAEFTNLYGNKGEISLQSRLSGGEGGIRILGTGVTRTTV